MQPSLVDVSERAHPVAQAFERRPGLIGENADATDVRASLGDGRERPSGCRAAEQRDEVASLHSITSSAVASSVDGTVRPSILAVSALITSSNLLACTTGNSAGFAPLRMRPT